jgi:hypothetical protein
MNKIVVIRNNEIINIGLPFPQSNPEEGLQENGDYILYVDDSVFGGLMDYQVIERSYWNGTTLVERPPRPSPYCTWNMNTLAWEVNETEYMYEIRRQRTGKLYQTDWTQLADAPLTSEQLQEAATYRQALRDMIAPILADPQAYVQIEDAPWPTPPSFINAN